MEKLTIFSKDKNKIRTFSKINLFFGYAKSGKTTLLEELCNIFSGKNRHYLVNGTQTINGDFNVFNISSSDGIKDHLKLSSKSLLRKMIEENSYSKEFSVFCSMISNGIEGAKKELEGTIRLVLPGAQIEISDSDSPLDMLIANMSVSIESDSSSEEKEELFSLVRSLTAKSNKENIVLVDDFNTNLDEEGVLSFFEQARQCPARFFLTCKTAIPQSALDEDTSIFCIRNGMLYSIPPLNELIGKGLEEEENGNMTFEEYMLSNGYSDYSGIKSGIVKAMKNDQCSNVFRILTSKSPIISNDYVSGRVCIVPKSSFEENIYRKLLEMLDIIPSDDDQLIR